MTDRTHVEEEYEEVGLGRYLAIAGVVAVVLAVGAFFAGRAAAGGGGPATLADAVSEARAGKLPCGTSAQPASPGFRANPDLLVAAVCDTGGQGFRRAGGGFFGGPGGVSGRLQSVSGSTLTIQGRQGTQKVKLGAGTRVRTYATGSRRDLEAGDTVVVSGGRDGAPQTVTVLPAGRGGP